MAEQCVDPVTLADPGTLPAVAAGKDTAGKIATALMLAATHIVSDVGGDVEKSDITWSGTRSFPTCCNHVQVGVIVDGPVDSNGFAWLPTPTRWELLISQNRPKVSEDGPPVSGSLTTPARWSITGHALHMSRIFEAIIGHVIDIAVLYLPEDCVGCDRLQVTSAASDRETCDQIRFTIESVIS